MGRHSVHGGGFLPAGTSRAGRRAARREWQAAAAGLVAAERDAERAARHAEAAARKAQDAARTPRDGEHRPWAARTSRPLRVRAHRATSANLAFAYPFLADRGLGSAGPFIGRDALSGASFCYCGFELYRRRPRVVSNTNMLIAGNIGWGKTNTAMAIAVRNIPFGRRIIVPGDPKDDWLRLSVAVGGQGIRLGRGLPARLNPLDGGCPPDRQGRGRVGVGGVEPSTETASRAGRHRRPGHRPARTPRGRRARPGVGQRGRRSTARPRCRRSPTTSATPTPRRPPPPGIPRSCCGTGGSRCTRCWRR